MKSNVKVKSVPVLNFEGGVSEKVSPEKKLERAVASCMLFENTYYESGVGIADRIAELVPQVELSVVGGIAIKAKEALKLRHVPLWVAVQMLKHPKKAWYPVDEVIEKVVRRPDELGEMVKLYWKGGKCPLAAALKRGLAMAFTKFDAYQLAKWNREAEIRLRDVLFMVHAKPKGEEQAALWKQLVDGTLAPPDTWEVALSAGKEKKATWERLLVTKKLPYMALLMNLRNMESVGVERKLVQAALMQGAEKSRALPFRFVSAAKAAPGYAGDLSDAMVKAIKGALPGHTELVVDVSGSMDSPLSTRSTLTLMEAAGALAVLAREVCESVSVWTFSNSLIQIPNYRGLALVDAIKNSQPHGGTYLRGALEKLGTRVSKADRVIVITDEQAQDAETVKVGKGYIINVGPYNKGLKLGKTWQRVNGWSERVLDWVCFEEYGKLVGDFEGGED